MTMKNSNSATASASTPDARRRVSRVGKVLQVSFWHSTDEQRQLLTHIDAPRIQPMPEQTNPSQPISSYQLVRWARQERSALIAAYLRSAAAYLAASLGGYVRYVGGLARRLAHELYLRNATRTLQQFDDRILADIGLHRGEIEYVVRNGRSARARKRIPTRTHSRHCQAA
jgi:uncharacterized protein YjiS (DUF1127 family)